jgi:CheY-like chemotaxis protein
MALMIEWGTEAYIPGVRFLSIPVQSLAIANILNGKEDIKGYSKSSNTVRFTFPRARILVVDDIATNLKVAEGLLAPYRTTVDTSLTGLQSLEMVKQNEYDIVFMDHMMPVMDGIETTAAIRAWEKEQHKKQRIPIIALTANAVVGMREMFLESGFDDFLSKPIDISKLDEMLDRWIPKEKRDTRKNAASGNGASSDSGASDADDTQKGSSKSAKADPADIKEMYIPGVDTAKGIALTGGVFETYKQLLFMLSKDIDERLQFFRKEITTDTLPDFVTHVHSLKSASASIGAGEISSLAAGLEAIGKAGDAAFIRESLPDFTKKLEELKKNILSGLTQISIV